MTTTTNPAFFVLPKSSMEAARQWLLANGPDDGWSMVSVSIVASGSLFLIQDRHTALLFRMVFADLFITDPEEIKDIVMTISSALAVMNNPILLKNLKSGLQL